MQLRGPVWRELGKGPDCTGQSQSLGPGLGDTPAIETFLTEWDGHQHDAHEFLQKFLSTMQPPCLNSHW